jgi:phosphotransferase system HPr-like phosphotransfer protein
MKISVKLIQSNDEIIANCPELDINCYGSDRNEAIRRIGSVIHFYINSAKELGLDVENLREIEIDGEKKSIALQELDCLANETIN